MQTQKMNFLVICAFFALSLMSFGSLATASENEPLKSDFEHFYDNLTMDKVSKLYWKLGKFDLNIDDHVDNFLRINECDIYKDYYFNEFDWGNVRNKARVFLQENAETFPVRFKYTQPLRMTDYDKATQRMNIHPDFQIKGYRKFEVLTDDFSDKVCNVDSQTNIPHYPRILMVELTQPLTLKSIPMKTEMAMEYIQDKRKFFDTLDESRKTRENLHKFRDAYIVMKIKMFSYKGETNIMNGWMRASVYGMLEGYEVYADREHTKLLYFENYIRDQENAKPLNVRLKEQYEALRRKRGQSVDSITKVKNPAEQAVNAEEPKEQGNSLMDLKKSPTQ